MFCRAELVLVAENNGHRKVRRGNEGAIITVELIDGSVVVGEIDGGVVVGEIDGGAVGTVVDGAVVGA